MGKENYIGLAMGLDVSDLRSGISEANKQIQLANSEFKSASSGMDDWTKSADGLSAKVKQLEAVLGAQESKLAGLNAEYEKTVKEQGAGSDAAQKLQVQINNQQAVVNKTAREFGNYTETLKKAENGEIDLDDVSLKAGKAVEKGGNQAATASDDVKELGDSADTAAKDVKDLGDSSDNAGGKLDGLKSIAGGVVTGVAAIGGAIVGAVSGFLSLAESTKETQAQMSKLEQSFKTQDFSLEDANKTMYELQGVVGDTDRAVESANFLAKVSKDQEDLAENTRILTGVYSQYGDSIPMEGLAEGIAATAEMSSVQGVLADALEWQGVNLDEFNAQLGTIESSEGRAALVQETLSKLYGESADEYQKANKDLIDANNAQLRLDTNMAELGKIALPIMTEVKTIAADLLDSIMPFVELIGEGLTGALNGTEGAAEKMGEGIGGILTSLTDVLKGAVPMVADVAKTLVPEIINGIVSALPVVTDAAISIVLTLVDSIITAIPQLIGAAEQIMLSLMNGITLAIPKLLPAIVQAIYFIIDRLVGAVPELLKAAVTLLKAIVDAIPRVVQMLMAVLPDLVITIMSALTDGIPMILDGAVTLLNSLIEAIPIIIDELMTQFPFIIETIMEMLAEALPLILDSAIALFNAIIEAIPIIIQQLLPVLPSIIETIITAVVSAVPLLIDAAMKLFYAIVDAIPMLIQILIKELPSIAITIINALLDSLPLLMDAARELFWGILTAIPKIAMELLKNMPEIITAILDGLGAGLVGIKDAGLNLVKGLWEGIKDAGGWVLDKIKGFGKDILNGIKGFFGIASPSKLMENVVGKNIGLGVGVGITDSLKSVKKDIAKFNDYVVDNLGNVKTGLSVTAGAIGGGSSGINGATTGRNTVINAGQTIYYNGNLSRKELKQLEDDQMTQIKLKLRKEGAI